MSKVPPQQSQDGSLICPDCGGPVWDNREKKRNGTFDARSPDFSCKDRDGCNYAYWSTPRPTGGGRPGGGGRKQSGRKPGGSLARALYESYVAASKVADRLADDGIAGSEVIGALASALLQAHAVSGRPIMELAAPAQKKPAPPPPPPPPPQDDGGDDNQFPF